MGDDVGVEDVRRGAVAEAQVVARDSEAGGAGAGTGSPARGRGLGGGAGGVRKNSLSRGLGSLQREATMLSVPMKRPRHKTNHPNWLMLRKSQASRVGPRLDNMRPHIPFGQAAVPLPGQSTLDMRVAKRRKFPRKFSPFGQASLPGQSSWHADLAAKKADVKNMPPQTYIWPSSSADSERPWSSSQD